MKIPEPRKLPSGSWNIQLRFTDDLGKRHSVSITADTKQECKRQAQLRKAQHEAGVKLDDDKKGSRVTVSQAIDRYIANMSSRTSPATIRGYKNIQRNRFQTVMHRQLSDISQAQWQRIGNQEAQAVSAKTVKNAWGLIRSVIEQQTGERVTVNLPPMIRNERPVLLYDQIPEFLSAVRGTKVEAAALLALHSLRCSEILALTWSSIDLQRDVIHVRGAVVPDENHKMTYKAENKTAVSRRDVPIMIPRLREIVAEEQPGHEPSAPIVTVTATAVRRRINAICSENGLPEVGWHGLRHSFASLAFHLGVEPEIAMRLGGWSDLGTMRNIYTHISDLDLKKRADGLESYFSSISQDHSQTSSP